MPVDGGRSRSRRSSPSSRPAPPSPPRIRPPRPLCPASSPACGPRRGARRVRARSSTPPSPALTPDPAVAALTRRQPELTSRPAPISPPRSRPRGRPGRGDAGPLGDRSRRDRRRFRVPVPILVAIWGLETDYGASPGNKDVIRSMATLGAMGYRATSTAPNSWPRCAILQRGDVTRERLRGSWAGAMGRRSSCRRASSLCGGRGRRRPPRHLGRRARHARLHRGLPPGQGWQPDPPWGFEVTLPPGFDTGGRPRALPGLGRAGRGAGRWRRDAGRGRRHPVFPGGREGPAFLVTDELRPSSRPTILRTPTCSPSRTLADRMAGAPR